MRYKLQFDPLLEDTGQKTEAYLRMHRAGKWFEDNWWEPHPSQDAEKRIEREGFIIIDTKEQKRLRQRGLYVLTQRGCNPDSHKHLIPQSGRSFCRRV